MRYGGRRGAEVPRRHRWQAEAFLRSFSAPPTWPNRLRPAAPLGLPSPPAAARAVAVQVRTRGCTWLREVAGAREGWERCTRSDSWMISGTPSESRARNLRTTAAVLGAAASVLEATAYVLEEVPGRHRLAVTGVWQSEFVREIGAPAAGRRAAPCRPYLHTAGDSARRAAFGRDVHVPLRGETDADLRVTVSPHNPRR
jgi:hypothetical protein